MKIAKAITARWSMGEIQLKRGPALAALLSVPVTLYFFSGRLSEAALNREALEFPFFILLLVPALAAYAAALAFGWGARYLRCSDEGKAVMRHEATLLAKSSLRRRFVFGLVCFMVVSYLGFPLLCSIRVAPTETQDLPDVPSPTWDSSYGLTPRERLEVKRMLAKPTQPAINDLRSALSPHLLSTDMGCVQARRMASEIVESYIQIQRSKHSDWISLERFSDPNSGASNLDSQTAVLTSTVVGLIKSVASYPTGRKRELRGGRLQFARKSEQKLFDGLQGRLFRCADQLKKAREREGQEMRRRSAALRAVYLRG